MSIEPFKYLIQPVALERDENGRVIRELPGEVLSIYSAKQAMSAICEFEILIASQNGAVDAVQVGEATPIHAREAAEDRREVGQEVRREDRAEEENREEKEVSDARR